MKRLLIALSIFSVATLFASCGMNVLHGEGKKISEIPSVDAFDAVDVSIASDIKITVAEGSPNGITLNGYENIIKHIKTEVKGRTLYISYDLDDTWTIDNGEMDIRISVPSLRALSLSGAPDVEVAGNIKGQQFELNVSGASEVVINSINTDKLAADMSGAASLEIKSGNVLSANYEVSGVGKIEAFGLQTEETEASISGTGKCELNVSRRLEAEISGAGSIKYKGHPEVIKHVSGIGSISSEE